jgi:hypothetical protein
MGRKRREQQVEIAAVEAVESPVPESLPEQLETPEVRASDEQVPAPVAPTAWKVGATVRVSLFGQITTLPEGTLVTARSYGLQGIARLREQGVKLEPV